MVLLWTRKIIVCTLAWRMPCGSRLSSWLWFGLSIISSSRRILSAHIALWSRQKTLTSSSRDYQQCDSRDNKHMIMNTISNWQLWIQLSVGKLTDLQDFISNFKSSMKNKQTIRRTNKAGSEIGSPSFLCLISKFNWDVIKWSHMITLQTKYFGELVLWHEHTLSWSLPVHFLSNHAVYTT